MSSWISNMRGFARGGSKMPNQPGQPGQPKQGNMGPGNYVQTALSPSQANLAPSPTPSPSAIIDNPLNQENLSQHRKPPFFFREQYANLIVKGNFMTLAAKPVLIEEGEWLAHQVVEQNRLLDGMLKVIQEQDRSTGLPICNTHSCPAMTAGTNQFTWMDSNKNPVRVPAPQYISFVQRWIAGKVTNPSEFPTETFTGAPPSLTPMSSVSLTSSTPNNDPNNWLGKPSGFPSSFSADIRNMYRQMFRCYAHVYHTHWMEFWHLGAYKELNTCFIHFVNVGRLFGLLGDKDLEPMGPLIDIWLEKGWLPRPSSSGSTSGGGGSGHAQGQGQGQQLQGQGLGQSGSQASMGA